MPADTKGAGPIKGPAPSRMHPAVVRALLEPVHLIYEPMLEEIVDRTRTA
ncbi:hypothetical protein GCM10022232_86360 [Streptomyces plumbiresistens]|uniref:Uncharacterized protein n=1 Tax=Streptomyces plumbiresistens TaxID=511811 RepID=A0ABP7TJN8_9ACTN